MLILLGIWIMNANEKSITNTYIVQIFSSEFDLIPKKTHNILISTYRYILGSSALTIMMYGLSHIQVNF